jgi:hypothetical protein
MEPSPSASIPFVLRPLPLCRPIFSTCSSLSVESKRIPTRLREDSPDWQELAPEFATEPVQIDLMATPASGVSCASRLIRKSIVRASVYRQLRLRLVPDQSVAGQPQLKHNECGGSGFNCVVDTNGHAHALALKNGAHDFLITSNRITEGSFNVLPDTETHLSIVFDPYSSLAAATADAVQIMPVFSAETAVACDSPPSLP